MRNLILGASMGLAALVSAAPAQAAPTSASVTFYANGTNKTLPGNAIVAADFDPGSKTYNTGAFTADPKNSGTRYGIASKSTSAALPVVRPLEASGSFAYVIGGAKYTVSFNPAQVFTFIFGSLDSGNKLTLNFADGTSKDFIGGQLSGLATTVVNPNLREGRFFYDARAVGGNAKSIVSAVFTSNIYSAFEFDSIATAAPEPATWAMMILGFGLVGGMLRRKRPVRTMAIA